MKKIIVDIDGTITKVGDRLKHLSEDPPNWDAFYERCYEDEPIDDVIDLVWLLQERAGVVFCTGRRESCREKTVKWIEEYTNIWRFDLYMRPDGNKRHDTEIKPWLIAHIPKEEVLCIIEDRNSMVEKWRELGYLCLQPVDGDF